DVAEAVLGEESHRALRVRQGRGEPADDALPGVAEHGFDHVLDDLTLLRLVHVEEVARVVDAVGEELPARRAARLDDLRVVLAKGGIERDTPADAAAAHELPDPPA